MPWASACKRIGGVICLLFRISNPLKARLQMRSWIYLQSQSCPHQWLGMEDAKSDVCVGVHACIGQIMFDGSSSVDGVICTRETTGRKHMRWGMESRDCSDRQRLVLLCCSILLNHSFNKVQFIRNLFVQCCNVYCAETFLNHLVPNSVYQKVWYNMCNSMKYEWCCLSRCEGMWGTCLLMLAASDWRRDCRWGVGSTSRASLAHTSDLEWKMPNQMYVWVCMRVLVIIFDGSSSADGVICSRDTTGRKHMRWGMESRNCSDR